MPSKPPSVNGNSIASPPSPSGHGATPWRPWAWHYRQALTKAAEAYGPSVARDLGKAIDRLQHRAGWLERCMQAMAVEMPKAVLWQKVRALRRIVPEA